MFFVGWGKNAKPVAYMGMAKCPHCRNYAHIQLCEVKKKISVMFVPVAKFDTHHYAVCSVCGNPVEIPPEAVDEWLRDSAIVPSQQQFSEIWSAFADVASDENILTVEDGVTALKARAQELEKRYSRDHIEVVLGTFIEYLGDDDRPR